MKKTMTVLTITAFALALGAVSALAAGNGITVFDSASVDDGAVMSLLPEPAMGHDEYVEGSSAGGLRQDRELYNGITYFGAAARAGDDAGPGLEIGNGITVFSTEPLSFD